MSPYMLLQVNPVALVPEGDFRAGYDPEIRKFAKEFGGGPLFSLVRGLPPKSAFLLT